MEYSYKTGTYFIRFDSNEAIIEKLTQFLEKQEIHSGYFHAIGAISRAVLRYFDQTKHTFIEKQFIEGYEVTNLSGNISIFENKPYIHSHIVLANKEFRSISGHLHEGWVGPTLEMVLTKSTDNISRNFDEEIGLNLFDFMSEK